MKYYEIQFHIVPNSEIFTDVLSALLAEDGFEAFEPHDDGLLAWIQQSFFDKNLLDTTIQTFPLPNVDITYFIQEAPDENWNQQWEQEGFKPIIIEDNNATKSQALIVIHDTNHLNVPVSRYNISINPCQAFGTGSHETTRMILRQLLDMPMKGRNVVDAGTGTGILSILCSMLGAENVFAYDIDEWSVRNAQSNLLLNGIESGVDVVLGDSSVLNGKMASLLIANINRNILLADIPNFAKVVPVDGELLLSGFYTEDVALLLTKAEQYGFSLQNQINENNWSLLLLKKEKSS